MVLYDSNGKVLDSVQYNEIESKGNNGNISYTVRVNKSPWEDENEVQHNKCRKDINIQLLPDRFLMTSVNWDPGREDLYVEMCEGDDFLQHFPLSSLDYKLWQNMHEFIDNNAEIPCANEVIANLYLIDSNNFREWLKRPSANIFRQNIKDLDRPTVLNIYEGEEEGELDTEFMSNVE